MPPAILRFCPPRYFDQIMNMHMHLKQSKACVWRRLKPRHYAPCKWQLLVGTRASGADEHACTTMQPIFNPRPAGPPSEGALLRDWGGFLPPWIAYRAVKALATALDRVRDSVVPPQLRMVEHSMAFSRTQVQASAIQQRRDVLFV